MNPPSSNCPVNEKGFDILLDDDLLLSSESESSLSTSSYVQDDQFYKRCSSSDQLKHSVYRSQRSSSITRESTATLQDVSIALRSISPIRNLSDCDSSFRKPRGNSSFIDTSVMSDGMDYTSVSGANSRPKTQPSIGSKGSKLSVQRAGLPYVESVSSSDSQNTSSIVEERPLKCDIGDKANSSTCDVMSLARELCDPSYITIHHGPHRHFGGKKNLKNISYEEPPRVTSCTEGSTSLSIEELERSSNDDKTTSNDEHAVVQHTPHRHDEDCSSLTSEPMYCEPVAARTRSRVGRSKNSNVSKKFVNKLPSRKPRTSIGKGMRPFILALQLDATQQGSINSNPLSEEVAIVPNGPEASLITSAEKNSEEGAPATANNTCELNSLIMEKSSSNFDSLDGLPDCSILKMMNEPCIFDVDEFYAAVAELSNVTDTAEEVDIQPNGIPQGSQHTLMDEHIYAQTPIKKGNNQCVEPHSNSPRATLAELRHNETSGILVSSDSQSTLEIPNTEMPEEVYIQPNGIPQGSQHTLMDEHNYAQTPVKKGNNQCVEPHSNSPRATLAELRHNETSGILVSSDSQSTLEIPNTEMPEEVYIQPNGIPQGSQHTLMDEHNYAQTPIKKGNNQCVEPHSNSPRATLAELRHNETSGILVSSDSQSTLEIPNTEMLVTNLLKTPNIDIPPVKSSENGTLQALCTDASSAVISDKNEKTSDCTKRKILNLAEYRKRKGYKLEVEGKSVVQSEKRKFDPNPALGLESMLIFASQATAAQSLSATTHSSTSGEVVPAPQIGLEVPILCKTTRSTPVTPSLDQYSHKNFPSTLTKESRELNCLVAPRNQPHSLIKYTDNDQQKRDDNFVASKRQDKCQKQLHHINKVHKALKSLRSSISRPQSLVTSPRPSRPLSRQYDSVGRFVFIII